MKSLIPIVCILLVLYIDPSQALECYECMYFEGAEQSDPNCLDNLNSVKLKNCDNVDSIGYSAVLKRPSPEEIANKMTAACLNSTGVLSGRPILFRSCGLVFTDTMGKCEDISKISQFDTECACSEDKCNNSHRMAGIPCAQLQLFALTVYLLSSYFYNRVV